MLWWSAIFFLNILLDITYTQYTIHSARLNARHAAWWSVAIVLLVGANVISYTQNPWLLIPAAVGAFLGTWVAIDFQKFKDGSGKEAVQDDNCS